MLQVSCLCDVTKAKYGDLSDFCVLSHVLEYTTQVIHFHTEYSCFDLSYLREKILALPRLCIWAVQLRCGTWPLAYCSPEPTPGDKNPKFGTMETKHWFSESLDHEF